MAGLPHIIHVVGDASLPAQGLADAGHGSHCKVRKAELGSVSSTKLSLNTTNDLVAIGEFREYKPAFAIVVEIKMFRTFEAPEVTLTRSSSFFSLEVEDC